MPDTQYRHFVLIPHPQEPRVLMVEDEPGWSLPQVIRSDHRASAVHEINEAVRNAFGIDVTTLQCIYFHSDPDQQRIQTIDALENHSPNWTPPDGARWMSHEEISGLTLTAPEHRHILEGWLTKTAIPELRTPWARPGWFKEAVGWIGEQCDRFGIGTDVPVMQVRSWSLTCMLLMASSEGDLYFKAVPPMFGREPLLTQALAEQYPMHLPELVAIDAERGWILMRDFGGTVIQQVLDFTHWEAALQRYAEIQIEQVGNVERLMALGCVDRGLNKLAQQMDGMLADTTTMLAGDRRGLSQEEISSLHSLAPTLKAMCEQLAKSPIPYTLVHADFHSNNIAINGEQIIYYDWTDGCIAFPFFDLVVFLNDSDLPADIPDARTRLRDAYLEPWTRYVPMDGLVTIWELAYPLGALHHAVSYHDILLNTEQAARWELEGALSFWLKLVNSSTKSIEQ